MLVAATPSGKAPPGRLRFGVGAMALVTAFPVAARGSHADNRAGPARLAGTARTRADRQLRHSRRAPASGSSRCRRSALPRCASRTRRPLVSAGSVSGIGAAGTESEAGTRRGWTPGRAW
jgi:hypothetical protein